MKKSINQLRVELAQIQQSHLQLNDFFWGDFLRSYKEDELNYPMMGAFYPSGSLLLRQTQIQLTIWVCDKIYEDWSNLNEVESDTLQICRDIFNVINNSHRWQLIGRVQSCTVTKFIERGGDCVAGHQMVFQFLLRDSESICGLPMTDYDFEQSVGAGGCAPVQIYKDGILIESVDPGGIFEYVSDVVTITDTDNNTLYEVTGTETQIIQDTNVSNSDDSYNVNVLAEGSLELPDIRISNQDDTFDITYPASKEYEIPNTTITNSNGSYNAIIASCVEFELPDSTIVNSDESFSVQVPTPTSYAVPDSQVNVNSVNEGNVVSVKTIDINITDGVDPVTPTDVTIVGNTVTVEVPESVLRSTAKLMKSGQTISYITGDDGDLEHGRLANFLTLDAVPVHNNGNPTVNTTTNRFTDELGGQTYTNRIMIDWGTFNGSTVLGYRMDFYDDNTNSDDATAKALLKTVGGFSGWSLTNIDELENLKNIGVTAVGTFNYPPLNYAGTQWNLCSSSTPWNAASTVYVLTLSNGTIGTLSRTVGGPRYMIRRDFNVVGTTLT